MTEDPKRMDLAAAPPPIGMPAAPPTLAPPLPPTVPPPGWYPDPTGQTRWWTGDAWGPPAPPSATPANRSNNMAVIAHVGGIIGTFIPSLVVYLVADGKDRFARRHGAAALNWQLTLMLATIPVTLALFVAFSATFSMWERSTDFGEFPTWLPLVMVPYGLINMANLVLSIIGMVKANRGEVWRYPVRIPFVKEEQP